MHTSAQKESGFAGWAEPVINEVMPPKKDHYSVSEAAAQLGISRQSVHEAIKEGRLKAKKGRIVKVTRGWQISSQDLRAYRVSLSHQKLGKKRR